MISIDTTKSTTSAKHKNVTSLNIKSLDLINPHYNPINITYFAPNMVELTFFKYNFCQLKGIKFKIILLVSKILL